MNTHPWKNHDRIVARTAVKRQIAPRCKMTVAQSSQYALHCGTIQRYHRVTWLWFGCILNSIKGKNMHFRGIFRSFSWHKVFWQKRPKWSFGKEGVYHWKTIFYRKFIYFYILLMLWLISMWVDNFFWLGFVRWTCMNLLGHMFEFCTICTYWLINICYSVNFCVTVVCVDKLIY